MTEGDWAWIAGIFDACGVIDKVVYPQADEAKVLVRIRCDDDVLLMHIQKLIGKGNVHIRDGYKSYTLRQIDAVGKFITKIYPYSSKSDYIVRRLVSEIARPPHVEISA